MNTISNKLKKELLYDIRKGIGRAYTTLRDTNNRNEYKDTIIFACLHDCSYNYIAEGPKSDYLFSLIRFFDSNTIEEIKKTIVLSLDIIDGPSLIFQKLELLREYYNNGYIDVKDDILIFYDKFITETNIWTKKRTLSFEILAIELDRIFGIKKTKEVISFINKNNLDLYYFGWYQSILERKYKNNEFILEFILINIGIKII